MKKKINRKDMMENLQRKQCTGAGNGFSGRNDCSEGDVF